MRSERQPFFVPEIEVFPQTNVHLDFYKTESYPIPFYPILLYPIHLIHIY